MCGTFLGWEDFCGFGPCQSTIPTQFSLVIFVPGEGNWWFSQFWSSQVASINYLVLWQLHVGTGQNRGLSLAWCSVTIAGWWELQFLCGLIVDFVPVFVSVTQICYWY